MKTIVRMKYYKPEKKKCYSPSYLCTIARIVANENPLNLKHFFSLCDRWLPVKRDSKTNEILFPTLDDYDFLALVYQWQTGKYF